MKIFLMLCTLFAATSASADSTSVIQAIVDRNLTNDHVSESSIKSDGTLSGVFKGARYEGTWEIRNGMYCRVIASFNLDGCQNLVALQNADGQLVGVEFRDPGKDSGNRYFLN